LRKALGLLFLSSLIFFALALPVWAEVTTIGPVANKTEVNLNEEFNVAVKVSNVAGLMGATFELSFDPQVLAVVDTVYETLGMQISPGDVFAGKGDLLVFKNEADNLSGSIRYSALVINAGSSFSGTGNIALIKFKAIATGNTEVKFKTGSLEAQGGIELAGLNGAIISAGSFSATLKVLNGQLPPPPPPPTNTAVGPAAEKSEVGLNEEFNVAVKVSNVTGLMGATFELSFDPQKLAVIDADGNQPGLQVSNGNTLAGKSGFIEVGNKADNSTGSIEYSALVTEQSSAFNGTGNIAVIKFKAKAEGTTEIKFKTDSLLVPGGIGLSGYSGEEISASQFTAIVKISNAAFLTGKILLEKLKPQSPNDNSGVTVLLKNGDNQLASIVTGSDGAYTFNNMVPGTYTVEYFKAGYSKVVRTGIIVTAGKTTTLPDLTLLLGDMNNDTYINVQDLLWMARYIGLRPGDPKWPEAQIADVNLDTYINVHDLLRVAVNIGKLPPI